MAKKTATRIHSPVPNRESDNQTAQASSPAPADVKRPTSMERKRKAIEPPDSPQDPTGGSSSIEAQSSEGCEPGVEQQAPGASVEPLDSQVDPAERPSSIEDQTCDDREPEVEQNLPEASGEPQDSPDDPTERPSSIEDQTADGCDQGMEQQGPGASATPDSFSASDAEAKQCIPSDQHSWADASDICFQKPATTPRDDSPLPLSRAGHRASNGILRLAYIGFAADKTECIVAIEEPDDQQAQDRTLARDCIALFAKGGFNAVARLVEPLVRPFAEAASKAPAETFESFLSRAETYLKLDPDTETLEQFPDFPLEQMPEPIDWNYIKDKVTQLDGRLYQLSDVEHFRQLTKRVYEVTINGEPVIYKRADCYYSVCRELNGLQGAELLNIRAPRLVGVIGADTPWGGLLMTLVPASFDLSDLKSPADGSGDSAPRLQATTAQRRKWFEDISAAFEGFHRYNFAYGDVKPANILIDDDRQAWLIDFEGGLTPGWVDKNLLDTVEGDLQGLARLREFLGLPE
ncbi:hypothetical protein BJX68DRAFT_266859 [Aspergillus pseudodeflectus]|uniref:Protein kinase domain-containing protein n=1 Tax=Aspergillus pseudodeflectus TaxID=176178 RepID=A0ABR4KCQ6_9EURO